MGNLELKLKTMYKIKTGTPKGSKIHILKPRRVIDLDSASKADLKHLFEVIKHPYIDKV